MTNNEPEFSDVLIIGAGFSGIGAAYRIREKNPGLSYTILERRARLGGTWDLFRYPGIRSDSDIFTLCFPWEPWTRPEMIADGDHIWQYIADTARKHGIDQHIRFNTKVVSADWDSTTDTWTVQTEHDGRAQTYRTRFLASRRSTARWRIRSTGRNPSTTSVRQSSSSGAGRPPSA